MNSHLGCFGFKVHHVTIPISETNGDEATIPPSVPDHVPDKSPYSSEFLFQFCKEHWGNWISQVQRTLTRIQQDHLEAPSLRLENTMYGLEQLLHPLLKVIPNFNNK